MTNDGKFMTRKEQQRAEYEEHFYATWPNTIKGMTLDELNRLNENKLADINASYPETMLCLKHWVLTEIALRETEPSGLVSEPAPASINTKVEDGYIVEYATHPTRGQLPFRISRTKIGMNQNEAGQ